MAVSRDGTIWCRDERRSGVLVAATHPLNGIDYVEFNRFPLAPPDRQFALDVAFLKPPPAGLETSPQAFTVLGGVRIVGIEVRGAEAHPADPLSIRVFVDREGDFSPYILAVDFPGLDPESSEARFSFRAGCPSDVDCRMAPDCPEAVPEDPGLDYLAKDYQSFRRLQIELISQRNPDWTERSPADLGIAVVELFAYAGDYLSYWQDALGTEGYLDTCLHRASAARHARLIDYRMHAGRNAFGFVQLDADAGPDGFVPAGTRFCTRISEPLLGLDASPGVILPATADFDADPALARATVFEATALVRLRAAHNRLRIHAWGDAECCLARGTTEAYFFGLSDDRDPVAFRPALEPGEYLLLEEIVSPVTGAPADADPARRQVVRIEAVEDADHPPNPEDPVWRDVLMGGELTPRDNPVQAALPLQWARWRLADALAFPLCLSAETPEAGPIAPVSIARGNVVPVDHGRTSERRDLPLPFARAAGWPLKTLALPDAPLTHQPMPDDPVFAADMRLTAGRHDLDADPRDVAPAVALTLIYREIDPATGDPLPDPGGLRPEDEIWTPQPHLLDSTPFDTHFVAETDNAGAATLRFGDDQYGRDPKNVTQVRARYRIGNGRRGNIGAGALAHMVAPTAAELVDPAHPDDPPLPAPAIAALRQPLAARLGADPEPIQAVRQLAPEAFRAIQFRAVTEADWEEVALRHPAVAAAKARFRWTGSWHTVFVMIHPRDEANLVRLAGGGAALAPDFAAEMRGHLERFRIAGYDLAVRAARYVPLKMALRICVETGHFRGDVISEVRRVLSNRSFADGSRGFFHLEAFGFGDAVYLSQVYAVVEAVPGVESVTALEFHRYWEAARDELDRGRIPMAVEEIPRLDNDANFPDHGVLEITAVGGL